MFARTTTRAALAGAAALGLLAGAARPTPAQDTAPKVARKNNAAVPAPRGDKWWQDRHTSFLKIVGKGPADVVFLGDSITDAWGGEGHGGPGAKIFAKEFVPLKAINLGIGGDQTQHVLWRLQNGEFPETLHAKVVMLMIGTNNSGSNTAAEIADGIKAVVKEIHQRSPETKVLLLGVFPRGQKGKPGTDVVRKKLKEVNESIAKLDDGGKTVKYLDIGDKFLEPDGTLPKQIMPDYLHLSEEGYQRWADAVKGPIEELLGKK